MGYIAIPKKEYKHGECLQIDKTTVLQAVKLEGGVRWLDFKKPKHLKTARERILAVLIWRDPYNCKPIFLTDLAKITGISLKNVHKIVNTEPVIRCRSFENTFIRFLTRESLKRFYTLEKVMPFLLETTRCMPKYWSIWDPEVREYMMTQLPEDVYQGLMERVVKEIGFEKVKRKLDYW